MARLLFAALAWLALVPLAAAAQAPPAAYAKAMDTMAASLAAMDRFSGAILVANADSLLNGTSDVVVGPDGQARLVQRAGMLERALLNPAVRWILPICAAMLALWGGVRLYWSWRAASLKHETKAARAKV